MPSYMSYLRQMAILDAKDDDIQWITVKGNHVPIKKGQSKEEAVKSFFESKGKSSGGKSESKKEAKINHAESMINAHADRKAYKTWEEEEEFVAKELEKEGYSVPKGLVQKAMKNVYGEEYTEGKKESKKVDNSKNSGKVYTNTMSKIRNFKSKEEGTFDFETGKPKNYPDGFSVSFHQNEPDANGKWKSDYGRYSDEEYDKNVEKMVKKTGGELNIGYFAGTPEVSVWVKDVFKAVKFAIDNNQQSIWDWEHGDVLTNPYYDPKKNPMKQ